MLRKKMEDCEFNSEMNCLGGCVATLGQGGI